MNRDEAESATADYLRKRSRRRTIIFIVLVMLIGSIAVAHSPDDWSRFDHHTFGVIDVTAGDTLKISSGDEVKLMGIRSGNRTWLDNQVAGKVVTLLLESPQTRDAAGHLRACAYLDHQNLSVEAVKVGAARADRRDKTLFEGVIAPAEAEARKKKRGLWGSYSEAR